MCYCHLSQPASSGGEWGPHQGGAQVGPRTEGPETAQRVRARLWLQSQTAGVWIGSTSWMTPGFSHVNGDNYGADLRMKCGSDVETLAPADGVRAQLQRAVTAHCTQEAWPGGRRLVHPGLHLPEDTWACFSSQRYCGSHLPTT